MVGDLWEYTVIKVKFSSRKLFQKYETDSPKQLPSGV